jgi:hypothetical protein
VLPPLKFLFLPDRGRCLLCPVVSLFKQAPYQTSVKRRGKEKPNQFNEIGREWLCGKLRRNWVFGGGGLKINLARVNN